MEEVFKLANYLLRDARKSLDKQEIQNDYDNAVTVVSVSNETELAILLMQLSTLILQLVGKYPEEDYISLVSIVTGYGTLIKNCMS